MPCRQTSRAQHKVTRCSANGRFFSVNGRVLLAPSIYSMGMNLIRLICPICLLLLASINVALAQLAVKIKPDVVVCPVLESQAPADIRSPAPDFSAPHCRTQKVGNIEPQGKELWLQAELSVPAGMLDEMQPLALFISAKMSSQVYLNGEFIGQNGTPGSDRRTEFPGRMDALFYVPRSAINEGRNQLVMRVSSHLGFLQLNQPIHWIRLGTYQDPTAERLEHYWPTLFPFGVLFLGALCFGLLAIIQRRGWHTAFLPLMSLFAAGQLCFEVSRGLVPYLYPFQETRIVMILVFALGFGLSLLAHTLTSLTLTNKKAWFTAGVIFTLMIVWVTPGFDGKSAMAIGIPVLLSLVFASYLMLRKRQQANNLVVALSAFLLIVLLAPGPFLDIYFFYVVAGFLAVLFVQQIRAYADERETRVREQARADKLQLIIDQNESDAEQRTLSVNSANKSELVVIADIAYCKGAGDYVELVLKAGNTVLHNDSLNELEQILPPTFLRAHRSYIVNTALISSLQRTTSGTGILTLKNDETVPVSRRIMPQVKERMTN